MKQAGQYTPRVQVYVTDSLKNEQAALQYKTKMFQQKYEKKLLEDTLERLGTETS